MILRYLTTVLVMIFLAGIATAGLDQDGIFDRVVAVYHFENTEDSGPREFDGILVEEASIVDDGILTSVFNFKRTVILVQ